MKFPSLKGFNLAIDKFDTTRLNTYLEVSIPQRVQPRYRLASRNQKQYVRFSFHPSKGSTSL